MTNARNAVSRKRDRDSKLDSNELGTSKRAKQFWNGCIFVVVIEEDDVFYEQRIAELETQPKYYQLKFSEASNPCDCANKLQLELKLLFYHDFEGRLCISKNFINPNLVIF